MNHFFFLKPKSPQGKHNSLLSFFFFFNKISPCFETEKAIQKAEIEALGIYTFQIMTQYDYKITELGFSLSQWDRL
jgi:hypothetical protein